MMFAQIEHPYSPDRRFWLEVPLRLRSWINVGDEVLCNTAKGLADDRVVRLIDGISDDEFEEIFGFFPTAEIVGVYSRVYLDQIIIPTKFIESIPAPEKIAKRVKELYSGEFKTRIETDPFLELKDGYTAYLVAKMFDIEHFPRCLISIGDKSVFKTYTKEVAPVE